MAAIEKYVAEFESAGHKIYWPFRDTNQNDSVGLRICTDNRSAIEATDEIHIWWNPQSIGSHFDFGIVFALHKKIVLANRAVVEKLVEEESRRGIGKSFNKVLPELTK